MKLLWFALLFSFTAMAMRLPGLNLMNPAKRDTCDDAVDNIPRYDCDKPQGHTLNADGTCGNTAMFNPTVSQCAIYCEVRRTGFLGPQQNGPGDFGRLEAPGTSVSLTSGSSTTISYGFSIGGSKDWKDAISLGVSFDFSVSKTTIMSVTQSAPASPQYYSKWVFFPMLTETCGTVTQADYSPGVAGGNGDAPAVPNCFVDTVTTTGNVCSVSPKLDSDGNPKAIWSLSKLLFLEEASYAGCLA
ncbi:hypothetical protein F5Y01DRAFT_326133 [Xylaria sp. FL0043]|nr:hypothetical protein F5Y01DRAFT_326133 [Xylaria sp. FL0043]